MGGALAVHIAAKKVLPSLAAMVVVDVVEVCVNIYNLTNDAQIIVKPYFQIYGYVNC